MTIGRGRFLPQKYIILQKRLQKLPKLLWKHMIEIEKD